MKNNKKHRIFRIIGVTATLLTGAGAVLFFLKQKTKKGHFTAFTLIVTVILCAVMMCGTIATYAAEPGEVITETDEITLTEDETEPDEVITGDEVEIDIVDFIDPEREPNQLTPPGNLTLVDDLSGEQTNDKQFITVTTKNGNVFYIIIDRTGKKENVYFLNLVDEYDLMALMEGEAAAKPSTPATTTEKPPEQSPAPDEPAEPQLRQNNTVQLLIMFVVIAAVGGGAFYYFKVLKPKQGGWKKTSATPEIDEFEFDPDEDDLFNEYTDGDKDSADYDSDEEIPDFTVSEPTAPDSLFDGYGHDFTFGIDESDSKE